MIKKTYKSLTILSFKIQKANSSVARDFTKKKQNIQLYFSKIII